MLLMLHLTLFICLQGALSKQTVSLLAHGREKFCAFQRNPR